MPAWVFIRKGSGGTKRRLCCLVAVCFARWCDLPSCRWDVTTCMHAAARLLQPIDGVTAELHAAAGRDGRPRRQRRRADVREVAEKRRFVSSGIGREAGVRVWGDHGMDGARQTGWLFLPLTPSGSPRRAAGGGAVARCRRASRARRHHRWGTAAATPLQASGTVLFPGCLPGWSLDRARLYAEASSYVLAIFWHARRHERCGTDGVANHY